jgi:hypothetical protein
MTEHGLATGTFAGVPFTEALITLVGIYNVDDVVEHSDPSYPQRFWAAPATVLIELAGVGSGIVLEPTQVFSYSVNEPSHTPPSVIGIEIRPFSYSPLFFDVGFADPFINYDLRHSFGPMAYPLDYPPFHQTISTTVGDVFIETARVGTGETRFWSVQVDVTEGVPEPGALPLLMIGSLGLAAWRRFYRSRISYT